MTHSTSDTLASSTIRPTYTITPQLNHTPRGGAVVEFVLVGRETATAAAEEAPGGVTFLQADHLAAATAKRAAGGPHTGTASALVRFDGTLDRTAMVAALTDMARRHEEWRSIYSVSGATPSRAIAPAELISFEAVDTGRDLFDQDFVDYVVDRVAAEALFDVLSGMVFGAAQAEDHFTFYLGSDHGHTDGFSIHAAVAELADLYRTHSGGGLPTIEPAPSFTAYVVGEKTRAAAVTGDDPRVAQWREVLAHNDGRIPASPLDLGLVGDEMPQAVRHNRQVLDGTQLDAWDATIADTDLSFSGCVYAALAAAQHEMFGSTDYFTATVLSTRTRENYLTQGWLCNFAPIAFPIRPGVPLRQLAADATAAVRRARQLNEIPVHAVLGLLAVSGDYIPESGSPQMVSYIDYRRIPGADDPVAASSEVFTGLGRTRNSNMWVNRFPDALTIGTLVPDNDTARDSSTRYLDRVGRLLAAFAAGDDPIVGDAQAPA